MNLTVLLEESSSLYVIMLSIPFLAIIFLILYYAFGPGKRVKPKILNIQNPIFVVGISTITNRKTFIQDDAQLWKDFKAVRAKNWIPNRKEEHSFIAVSKTSESAETWEYLIGSITHDFSNVPEGAKSFEVPVGLYAAFPFEVEKNHRSWSKSILKMLKYIHEKWLPKSGYVLNTESTVREVEYHEKSAPNKTQKMILYIPIKKK